MMGRGRGAAPAGWLGGVVGAEAQARLSTTIQIRFWRQSGLASGPHRPETPPSQRRAPTTPGISDLWLANYMRVFVKYGDVKAVYSPARLPGTGKRRAESGLRRRSVATSSSRPAIASGAISPGSGMVSSPVPQTAE